MWLYCFLRGFSISWCPGGLPVSVCTSDLSQERLGKSRLCLRLEVASTSSLSLGREHINKQMVGKQVLEDQERSSGGRGRARSDQLPLWLSHAVLGTVCARALGWGCPSEQCPAVAGLHLSSSPVATTLNPHRRQTAQCPPKAVCTLQALASLGCLPGTLPTPRLSLTFRDPLLPHPPEPISVDALSHVTVLR